MLLRDKSTKVNLISEAIDGSKEKAYYIEGIFAQAEVGNGNGRWYPDPILNREVERYVAEKVVTRRALGELTHPETTQINPDRASHIVTSLYKSGTDYIGKAKILDTPCGNIVKTFIKEGISFGVSTRGTGSVKKNRAGLDEVQSDFRLVAVDIVVTPSAPDAFVQGLYESADFIMQNDVLNIDEMDAIRKKVFFSHTSKDLKESIILAAFSRLLTNSK